MHRLLRTNSTEGAVGVAAVIVEFRRTGGGGAAFDNRRSPVLATDDIDVAADGTPAPKNTIVIIWLYGNRIG